MQLRDYQRDIFEQLIASCSNDLVQLDTGAGKTPIEAALAQWSGQTLLVAHRNLLIQQISEKLAAFGIEHDIVSTEHTRRRCMAAHRAHGRSYIVRGHTRCVVASMQSLDASVRHGRFALDPALPWLIVIDEAHHVVSDNMWGKLRTLFPRARIIGFTATPARMDGESLHAEKGGLFDRLVQASTLADDSVRVLTDRGYLSAFRAYAARTVYNIEERMTPRQRDVRFEDDMLRRALDEPTDDGRRAVFRNVRGLDWASGTLELIGDPVAEYMRVASGTRAIVMSPAIKNAELFARQFRDARIPSACINSTQSQAEIAMLLGAFRAGKIKVLTNVDMVGEGFDLPACQTLIMATRTASFPRYRQWCGRVLRPDHEKNEAIIIDLTGMCAEHGMPDEPVHWDLLDPPCGPKHRRQVPCDDCGLFFPFKLEHCPGCGAFNAWLERGSAFAAGSYQFSLKMIDQDLRGFVVRQRQQAQDAERMRTELLAPFGGFGSDLLGRTITALAAWFPRALMQAGVPIIEINTFLRSPAARDRNFYIRRFTRADLASDASAKAIKAYKAWRKQR